MRAGSAIRGQYHRAGDRARCRASCCEIIAFVFRWGELLAESRRLYEPLACRPANRSIDSSPFLEVVRIDTLHVVGTRGRETDLEIDHELSETPAINKDNLGFDVFDVSFGIGRKRAGCDDTPFLARLPWRAPTNFWISGRPTAPAHLLAWR
jgi:hypothetical protein